MRIPALTVSRTNSPSGFVNGASQRWTRAGRRGADTLLDETPTGLNRIEFVRVRWEKPQSGAAVLHEFANQSSFVRCQVIEHYHVAAPQLRGKTPAYPGDKPVGIDGPPTRAQSEPAVRTHGPDHGQTISPVHRPWFHRDLAARQPRMRPAHRQIRARFIEENEPPQVYGFRPTLVAPTLGSHVRTILFRRPRPFFLNTYPHRFSALNTLDRWTRPSGPTKRLYARVNSSVVVSGRSPINRCSTPVSTGETHPPPRSRGATEPVSRTRCTHRINVARWIMKSPATSVYVPSPSSYARTARSRSSRPYGFPMHLEDHKIGRRSSELWG